LFYQASIFFVSEKNVEIIYLRWLCNLFDKGLEIVLAYENLAMFLQMFWI